MTEAIYLPKIEPVKCSPTGKIDTKKINQTFEKLGQIPTQIHLQNSDPLSNCGKELAAAVENIDKTIRNIFEKITTQPFSNIKSLEYELKYRAKELSEDIEIFFKKKLVDILIELIGVLGLPNPLKIPIPFLAPIPPDNYRPVLEDLFTETGKPKVKQAINLQIEEVKKFFKDLESTFNGDLGINSPDLTAEEAWHKVKNWIEKTLNDFVGSVSNAIGNAVKNIPIIGQPIYDIIFSSVDPTIAIETAFDKTVEDFKKRIKKAKEDFLSGKVFENLTNKLIEDFINTVEGIQIPLVGSVGDYIDIDIKGKGIVINEDRFHEIENKFKELIEKARRFFKGDILVKIYDIIAKAPAFILRQFPIVGTIFDVLDKAVKILTGESPLTECDILKIIFPVIFNIGELITSIIPNCIKIEFTENGLLDKPATPDVIV